MSASDNNYNTHLLSVSCHLIILTLHTNPSKFTDWELTFFQEHEQDLINPSKITKPHLIRTIFNTSQKLQDSFSFTQFLATCLSSSCLEPSKPPLNLFYQQPLNLFYQELSHETPAQH